MEFGIEIGEYQGWFGSRGGSSSASSRNAHPLPCVEAYYLRQTRFETIAQQKLRRRQLTEDGNVEISGRDLRERSR